MYITSYEVLFVGQTGRWIHASAFFDDISIWLWEALDFIRHNRLLSSKAQ